MKKFIKGETFKLKGCRKYWKVETLFQFNGVDMCVASSTKSTGTKCLSIFAINKETNEIYERA